jgi:hypothetical protein
MSIIEKIFWSSLIVTGVILVASADASAKEVCDTRDTFVQVLDERYQETLAASGLDENKGVLVELFLADDGSWTLLSTNPAGESCYVASGDDWQKSKRAWDSRY